jgi:hypothetical protein
MRCCRPCASSASACRPQPARVQFPFQPNPLPRGLAADDFRRETRAPRARSLQRNLELLDQVRTIARGERREPVGRVVRLLIV